MNPDDTSAGPALLGPAEVRSLAARLGLRPTKRLGQNFVHDANTVRRIVATAQLEPSDTVLEVGPGLGSLTLGLLGCADRVTAVEIDPVLAEALPETVAERAPGLAPQLTVVTGDAQRITSSEVGDPTALVANLPYNVAVPVLLHLLVELPTLRRGLVMVQSEVADRLAAAPGSRTYGIPSVKMAWFAATRRAGTVPASVFWPVPHVESQLVTFTRRTEPQAPRLVTFALIDAAFAQRRKTLRAALSGWARSAAAAEELLVEAGVDVRQRGEDLGVTDFARIARVAVNRQMGLG